jgi:hypothetical protein
VMTKLDEESRETEITILPDGRVYVFGLTRQVLETLAAAVPQDRALARRFRYGQWRGRAHLFIRQRQGAQS